MPVLFSDVGAGDQTQVLRLAGQARHQHNYILSPFYSFKIRIKKKKENLFKDLKNYSCKNISVVHVARPSVLCFCGLQSNLVLFQVVIFVFWVSLSSFVL